MNLKKYNWQEYTTKEGLMNLLRETNEDNLIRLAVKELVDNAIDANRKAQQGKRSEDYIPL
jgi:spermidine/putrescine-binding protein